MKKCIMGLGAVILMTLPLLAEGNGRGVIEVDFKKPKVIDLFDKDQTKKKKKGIDGVCKYPTTTSSYKKLADRLAGLWSVQNQAGFVTIRGMTMPLPAEAKSESGFVLYTQSGDLVVNPPKGDAMVLEFAKDKGWKFDEKEYKDFVSGKMKKVPLTLTSEELSMVFDCDVNDLPRLVGKTTFDIEGTKMYATYRFIVLSDSMMYGIMNYRGTAPGGYKYDAKRAFGFFRD